MLWADSEMSWLRDLVFKKILLSVCNYLIMIHHICRLYTACCCVPLVAYLTCIPIFACYSWCINLTQNYLFIFFYVSLLCRVLSSCFLQAIDNGGVSVLMLNYIWSWCHWLCLYGLISLFSIHINLCFGSVKLLTFKCGYLLCGLG